MIQNESRVDVADNTGAKIAMVIRVLRGTTARGRFSRPTATVGDRVVLAVKKSLPGSDLKTGSIAKGVVVRTRYPIRRADGSYVKFDRNAVVLIDDEGNPRGTRIFGAVARELREKNYMKIVSLASEVV
ncbi:MAG: 50S ribosomal protein L14 [Phycisphaeraceae bacterium]|nr:50S ribosomal protein L14 [Phycisphaeraceae bacterium]